VVHPGATNQDLIIVANQPDGTSTTSANVLMIDDQGKLVENLRVVVTPFGRASATLQVHEGPDKATTYLCGGFCVNDAGAPRKKGMGDADNLTVTRYRDGSTDTWKHWSTPPTPPNK
jgi:hypothetical protein